MDEQVLVSACGAGAGQVWQCLARGVEEIAENVL